MKPTGKSTRLVVTIALALPALGVLGTQQLFAARGLINANQHPVDSAIDDCGDDPPLPILGSASTVGMQAYHVNKLWDNFNQARCYNHLQRPYIVSDDASFKGLVVNQRQKQYIDAICDSIGDTPDTARGIEHYEHWEKSLTDVAVRGFVLGGYSTWFDPDNNNSALPARDMVAFIEVKRNQGCVSVLPPNGHLARATSGDTRRITWNQSPVTLIGFGHMGVLAAFDRTLLVRAGANDGYLGTLRKYGANLTRVWAIEQWSGRAVCRDPMLQGLTPFSGQLPDYNLSIGGLNPAFFRELRRFSQLAADRGIVVQLTLFDKHGMVNRDCPSVWGGSPYNKENNTTHDPRFIDGSSLNNCDCPSCVPEGLEDGLWMDEECLPIDNVLNQTHIVPIHKAYIRRVAQEVGGLGNVVFETMNEMIAGTDWPEIGEEWQKDSVATRLNWELPTFTARDSFNDEGPGALVSKPPDRGTGTWVGVLNAFVVPTTDPETGLRMGTVHGSPTSTSSEMRGSLSLPGGSRTALSARARVTRGSSSVIEFGFASGGGEWLYLQITPPMIQAMLARVSITKKVGPTTTVLASGLTSIGSGTEFRLQVDLSNVSNPTASVFVEGSEHPSLAAIPLGTLPALNYASFRGAVDTGYFTDTSGWIDDFEANIFCNTPNSPFFCVP